MSADNGNGERIDVLNASEPELLIMAVKYLEDVRAHKRLVNAVRRAAIRLMDSNKEGCEQCLR